MFFQVFVETLIGHCSTIQLTTLIPKFYLKQCRYVSFSAVIEISLDVQFDQFMAEIFEVKDTRYHSFIFMIIDLLDMRITKIHHQHQYKQK